MGAFDQIQLRPQERRLLVLGAAILFVVLNLWFVWPHYGELGRVQNQIRGRERTLETFRTELARRDEYLAQLQALEMDGVGVLDRDKDLTLLGTVQTELARGGISHSGINTASGGSSEFFEQRTLSVNLNPTSPEALVRFLLSLATNQVVLRVKELDLKPDGTKTKLSGSVRIVASFQRETLVPPAATAVAATPRP
jgi:type II secretory pathway component PulM